MAPTVVRPASPPESGPIPGSPFLLALLLLLTPGAALALPQTPDSARVVPVEPITVTVLRGPVEAGREPFPVASMGEAALREGKAGAFLEEALEGLPGVQVQNRYNYAVGERISIRGFGPRAQFGVRGIKLLVDGIPATFADGQSALDHLDIPSLGRVEVMRGPASALYGNAGGGVLAFQTRPPALAPFRQEVGAVFGSHGLSSLQALASGTAGETGWLFSVGRLDFDGFRRDPTATDEDATYGEAKRWNANALVERPVGEGRLTVVFNALDLDAENPGSLSTALLAEPGRQAFRNNVLGHLGKEVRQGQLGGIWEGGGGGTDSELAAWGILRDVLNPIPGTVVDLGRVAGGARALFRGQAGGPLSWGAGAELEIQSDDRQNYQNNAGEKGTLTLDQHERVLATGLFAQARLEPGDRIELSAALRWDRFSFDAEDNFVAAGDPDDSGDRVMDALSPSLGVFLDAHRALGLYASVSTSLETPTTTELANRPTGAGGFNPDLEPQRGVTWEGGIRGLAGSRLGYELTVFRTDIEDELVSFEVPQDPGRVYFRNAGASKHQGWEAALRAVPADFLSLQLAWSHIDAEFEEYEVEGVDLSGNKVPGLNPDRIEGLVRFEGERWFVDFDAELAGRTPVADRPPGAQPETQKYELLDARAGVRDLALERLVISPYAGISNVFDRSYVSSVAVNAFGSRYFEPGPGRTFHVGLRAAWSAR